MFYQIDDDIFIILIILLIAQIVEINQYMDSMIYGLYKKDEKWFGRTSLGNV